MTSMPDEMDWPAEDEMVEEQADLFGELPADLAELLDKVDIGEFSSPHAWPKLLGELVDVVEAQLSRDGLNQPRRHAQRVMMALAHFGGGKIIYLPRGQKLRTALRNHEIWRRFNGKNVRELADEYRLTAIQIYNIIREQRALHRKRHQRDLFDS